MIETITYAVIIAMWADLFTRVLTGPDHVFSFVPGLYAFICTGRGGLVGQSKMKDWHRALAKPIFACAICHAGQVALWLYPVMFEYNFSHHATFVVVSMWVANKIGEWN